MTYKHPDEIKELKGQIKLLIAVVRLEDGGTRIRLASEFLLAILIGCY